MNSSVDLSRRNPQEDFELIQRIGSGTYGDVYKVKLQRVKLRSIIGQNVVLLHSASVLIEQWDAFFHVTVQPFVILWSLIFKRLST